MERLTERTADGILVKENYEKESLKTLYSCYGEKPNSYYSNCEEGYCAMEKLADYEDLEEHGRLVKLPCKVGDKVYGLSMGKIIRLTVNEISIFRMKGEKIINAKCQNNDEFRNYVEREFGKTVFITKSEAEAKLKELRGGENESSN